MESDVGSIPMVNLKNGTTEATAQRSDLPSKEELRRTHRDYDVDFFKTISILLNSRKPRDHAVQKDIFVMGYKEHGEDFKRRVELSPWKPKSIEILEAFLGALSHADATHQVDTESETENPETKQNKSEPTVLTDHRGTRKWVEEFFRALAATSRVAALVSPALAETMDGREPTPEEKGKVEKKHAVFIYSGGAILDWKHDEDGGLLFIKLAEYFDARQDWRSDEKGMDHAERYLIFTKTDGKVEGVSYNIINEQVRLDPNQPELPAGLDRIPVEAVIDEVPGIVPMISEMDLSAIRIKSDLRWDMYLHSHPQLVMTTPHRKKRQGENIPIGAGKFIALDAGDKENPAETLAYLVPQTAVQQQLAEEYNAEMQEIRQTIGIELGEGVQEASGVSIAWRFRTGMERHLVKYAEILQLVENRMMQIVKGRGRVTYSRDFATDPQVEAQTMQLLLSVLKPIKTAWKAVMRQGISRVLPDLTPEEQSQINKELDEAEPDVFGAQFGGGLFGRPEDDQSDEDEDKDEDETEDDEEDTSEK